MIDDKLQHYGIKGQKRGVRRFQNADGSRTSEGVKRYAKSKKEDLTRQIKEHVKDPRDYSRTAAAVLPTKKGKHYSDAAYALNAALAYIGAKNIGGLAETIAYDRGYTAVAGYIRAGTRLTEAAIVGGTAGKIITNKIQK